MDLTDLKTIKVFFLVEKNVFFFADSQPKHGQMIPILNSVQAIPPKDHVWKFERDLLSGSEVILHTIMKKAKTDTTKINTFRKTSFFEQ